MLDPNSESPELRRKASDFADRLKRVSGQAVQSARAAGIANGRGGLIRVPVREMPTGTRMVAQTADTVTVQFKAAVRFWWKVVFLMIPACFFTPPVGAFIGAYLAASFTEWAPTPSVG